MATSFLWVKGITLSMTTSYNFANRKRLVAKKSHYNITKRLHISTEQEGSGMVLKPKCYITLQVHLSYSWQALALYILCDVWPYLLICKCNLCYIIRKRLQPKSIASAGTWGVMNIYSSLHSFASPSGIVSTSPSQYSYESSISLSPKPAGHALVLLLALCSSTCHIPHCLHIAIYCHSLVY